MDVNKKINNFIEDFQNYCSFLKEEQRGLRSSETMYMQFNKEKVMDELQTIERETMFLLNKIQVLKEEIKNK